MDDLAALRLQIAWGVDEALADAPIDRRGAASKPAARLVAEAARQADIARPPPRAAAGAEPAAIVQAAALTATATTLSALRDAIEAFDGCALRDTATRTVLAEGDPSAELIVIGDTPGADDDRSGKPLTGVSGTYFDRMLASIGIDRARALLVPLIPWRPPGGRPPSERELAMCMPFLFRYVQLARSTVVIALGAAPSRCLLGRAPSRRRSGFVELELPQIGRNLSLLAMASPDQLMQQPRLRAAAWDDLRLLRRKIDQVSIKN